MIIQSILARVPETIRKIKRRHLFLDGSCSYYYNIKAQKADGKVKKMESFLNDFQERFADKLPFYWRQKQPDIQI